MHVPLKMPAVDQAVLPRPRSPWPQAPAETYEVPPVAGAPGRGGRRPGQPPRAPRKTAPRPEERAPLNVATTLFASRLAAADIASLDQAPPPEVAEARDAGPSELDALISMALASR